MPRLVVPSLLLLGAATAAAQSAPGPFAAPVRLTTGEAPLGGKRLFPSPVAHDVDGDGRLDLVIGDLPGALTVARRLPGAAVAFAADQPLPDHRGQPLKFHNW